MSYQKTNWYNLPNQTTPINSTNLNKIENGIADAYNSIGANAYDNTSTYDVGDYCIYNNLLYKCTTAITTAEEMNLAHWSLTSITEIINSIIIDNTKERINDNLFTMAQGVQLTENQSFRIGNIIFINLKLNANLTTSYDTYATLDSSIKPSTETAIQTSNAMLVASNGWIRANGQIAIKHASSGQNEDIRILSFYPLV